jgi:5-bromo-4-chloroindolyl phosphate hydrolysis protein
MRRLLAHLIGFTAGLAIALVLPITGVLTWWLALPLGLIQWAILVRIVMAGQGREFEDVEGLLVDPALLRAQLRRAEERIGRIRRAAFKTPHRDIGKAMTRVTDIARAIVKDVRQDPSDYPRVERALTSYLGHVETMALSLQRIAKVGEADPDTLQRLQSTLADTEKAMAAYRQKMIADERLELDVRLDLVERSLARDLDRIERR